MTEGLFLYSVRLRVPDFTVFRAQYGVEGILSDFLLPHPYAGQDAVSFPEKPFALFDLASLAAASCATTAIFDLSSCISATSTVVWSSERLRSLNRVNEQPKAA